MTYYVIVKINCVGQTTSVRIEQPAPPPADRQRVIECKTAAEAEGVMTQELKAALLQGSGKS
jgi:hypothetical protein